MSDALSQADDPALGPATWRVSIISHGHGRSVAEVLRGLHAANPDTNIRFVLTVNIPEDLAWVTELPQALRGQLQIKRNSQPQSFALNHNQALASGDEPYLVTADPELVAPFPALDQLRAALLDHDAGLVAPQALDENGKLEDNGRALPRPWPMLWRNLARQRSRRLGATYAQDGNHRVAWLAGFFLACRRSVWQELGGFDTRYRMYCEDVDLGLRCWIKGYSVQVMGQLRIGHPARRATFRHAQHLLWHVQSLLKLWASRPYKIYRRIQERA